MQRLAAILVLAALALSGAPKSRKNRVRVPMWTSPEAPVLTSSAIQAKLNGEPVKVLRVRGPEHDLVILIVLDLAGDLALIDLAREALMVELNDLPENAHVALLRAQDGLRVLRDPTGDRQTIATAMGAITPSGKAGLLETVQPALRLGDALMDTSSVRAAVLFVTDSNIYNYRVDYTNPVINSSDSRDLSRRFPEGLIRERTAQLAAELSRTEAPLFIVHLDYRRDRLNEAYQTGLLDLAQPTGGEARFCRSPAEIAPALERVMKSIRSHYRVDLELPENAGRTVLVQLGSEGRGLQHRQRYLVK